MSRFRGFKCDGCGASVKWFDVSASNALLQRWARERGWSFGKHDKCPNCKPGGKTAFFFERGTLEV